MELVEFLLARIGEDEAVAEAAQEFAPSPWRWGYGGPQGKFGLLTGRLPSWKTDGALIYGDMEREPAAHIARWDPARVLAECDAKRRLVKMASTAQSRQMISEPVLLLTLRTLAQPYAEHSDYDPAWNPEATQ